MCFWKSVRYMQSVLSKAIDLQLHALCVRGLYEMEYALKARMNKIQRNVVT